MHDPRLFISAARKLQFSESSNQIEKADPSAGWQLK